MKLKWSILLICFSVVSIALFILFDFPFPFLFLAFPPFLFRKKNTNSVYNYHNCGELIIKGWEYCPKCGLNLF